MYLQESLHLSLAKALLQAPAHIREEAFPLHPQSLTDLDPAVLLMVRREHEADMQQLEQLQVSALAFALRNWGASLTDRV